MIVSLTLIHLIEQEQELQPDVIRYILSPSHYPAHYYPIFSLRSHPHLSPYHTISPYHTTSLILSLSLSLSLSLAGILVSLITSFVATHIYPVTTQPRIELALRLQLIISTVLMIPCTLVVAEKFLPAKFHMNGVSKSLDATSKDAAICVICGTVSGLLIGITAEYYTSNSFQPVKDLVNACRTGAATNIIYGLALGYLSCIPPAYILAACIYVSFELCDLYGVALAAVGMLGNLSTCLTIDCYGPVCDNAGGIAEMAELAPEVRQKTDALDAAGNTTAAVGKGFAIASAAAVSLALYGAFVVRIRFASGGLISQVEILHPLTFAFLLIGANLPFWFSAMTMKSVGEAAMEMVAEVERQFREQPDLLLPNTHLRPDYDRCVAISTRSALREMIAPGDGSDPPPGYGDILPPIHLTSPSCTFPCPCPCLRYCRCPYPCS